MASMPNVGELLFEESALTGSMVALGAFVLVPVLGRVARPVAKELIKGGYLAARKAREVAVDSGERWMDLVAEARSELSEQSMQPGS